MEGSSRRKGVTRLDSAVFDRAVEALWAAGCIAAREEAVELVRACGGEQATLELLLERRCNGEPLAWLTGSVVFCGVQVRVVPGVYVPRWQSEPMALKAASVLGPGGTGLDLCTGAGAVAAVLGDRVPTARVIGTDIDETAVSCARSNGVEAYVGFLDGPVPVRLEGAVDVITAVAPYVPTGSMRLLPRDIREHEPTVALDGGFDGLDVVGRIVGLSPRWLHAGGWVVLEIGGDQDEKVSDLLASSGFGDPEVMRDEDGDVRAICAQLPSG